MVTVIIRKHATENRIEVEPEVAVLRPGEKLAFKVSGENGFEPGTRVTVKFQKAYRVLPGLALARSAARCGPFAHRSQDPRNPEEGRFVYDGAGDYETGAVEDRPWAMLPHTWKYDVSWTGLPDLDPIVKIERGG
jgi:hypothetical protein